MLIWILQSMFLSIIFILVVHHLIHFFKTTLTIPKMKDLVNAPTQKYDNIYNIIGKSDSSALSSSSPISHVSPISLSDVASFLPQSTTDAPSFLPQSTTDAPSFLPSSSSSNASSFGMKNELKHFLKTQLKG
jgi:hypothetical protein